jgi:hypothetical protein
LGDGLFAAFAEADGADGFFRATFFEDSATFFAEAACFLAFGATAFFALGAAVIFPGLWGFFKADFFPFLARTFWDPVERLLLVLVLRLLIISSKIQIELACSINSVRSPVMKPFISIIYRQVKKIALLGYSLFRPRFDFEPVILTREKVPGRA